MGLEIDHTVLKFVVKVESNEIIYCELIRRFYKPEISGNVYWNEVHSNENVIFVCFVLAKQQSMKVKQADISQEISACFMC